MLYCLSNLSIIASIPYLITLKSYITCISAIPGNNLLLTVVVLGLSFLTRLELLMLIFFGVDFLVLLPVVIFLSVITGFNKPAWMPWLGLIFLGV